MSDNTFADQLASLVSREAHASKGDSDRFGVLVERLAAALGFSVALAADGDPATIDNLLAGAEAYAHAEAVDKAPLVQLMAALRKGRATPTHTGRAG